MEEIMDFDEWLANYKPQEVEYVAVFDPQTGFVKSVGPSHAFESEKNKVSVDREVAEQIIEGTIKIGSCVIDVLSSTLEIAEVKNIFKIDDVLHRITDIKFAEDDRHDLYITHNSIDKTLIIELSEEYGGTKKLADEFQPIKKKNIIWDGDTDMNFLITNYNDPNLLFDVISVKLNSLIGESVIIKNVNYDDFSVYTRRLFKKCVIEHK